jgi:PQQ-like domain
MRLLAAAAAVGAVIACNNLLLAGSAPAETETGGAAAAVTGTDWPTFDFDAARHGVGPAVTGITAKNVGRLRHQVVQLDGTVDSAPIYLHDVRAGGKVRDVFFVTTTYGRTEAIDASTGALIWRYTPASYSSLAGSAQITTMTPLADPGRAAVYAGEPDGRIVKLSVANGRLLWSTSITRDPTHEKLAGSLNYSGGHVLAATDGYIGDAPPYQGHVVSLDPATGRILAVWNSLCSDRHELIDPATCDASDSAIWGRSSPSVDPTTGNIVVATGNAPWNGNTNWGDSVLVLSPDAKRLLKHWTPANQDELNRNDLDLGSTSPALLAGGYVVQGGKSGVLSLLSLRRMAGPTATTGGELQTVQTPGGAQLFSQPAVWRGTWLFVAADGGTQAWRLERGRLRSVWQNGNSGTSPVVAGGLLFVQQTGGIRVYQPATGRQLADLPLGGTHWESPIVADGRIAATEGNSNDHATSGVLNIYRTP